MPGSAFEDQQMRGNRSAESISTIREPPTGVSS
jgi:hypothetical protein